MIGLRTTMLFKDLARAAGQQLDAHNPDAVEDHVEPGATFDDRVNQYRRITHAIKAIARTTKAAGDLTAGGNCLL
jgi:hypothetical protein